jgi:hypothetical protein
VLIAACIGCIAENLTRFVDVHRVRQFEGSSGNNQGIEIDQPAGGQDEWNVFARPERLVGWGKIAVPTIWPAVLIGFAPLPCAPGKFPESAPAPLPNLAA